MEEKKQTRNLTADEIAKLNRKSASSIGLSPNHRNLPIPVFFEGEVNKTKIPLRVNLLIDQYEDKIIGYVGCSLTPYSNLRFVAPKNKEGELTELLKEFGKVPTKPNYSILESQRACVDATLFDDLYIKNKQTIVFNEERQTLKTEFVNGKPSSKGAIFTKRPNYKLGDIVDMGAEIVSFCKDYFNLTPETERDLNKIYLGISDPDPAPAPAPAPKQKPKG